MRAKKGRWTAAGAFLLACLVMLSGAVLADGAHTDHPVCGVSCGHEGAHGGGTWTPWTLDSALPTEYTAGARYYLTEDVTLDSGWSVGADLSLCLNGHMVRFTGKNAVTLTASLHICDCGTATHAFTVSKGEWTPQAGGTTVVTGGVIVGNATLTGGLFTVDGGALTLYGGTLAGGKGGNGGGVSVTNSGSLDLYGGVIRGCTAASGGGVYADNGTVHMYAGAIRDCVANDGGGVYLAQGSFDLHGGTIQNCSLTHTNSVGYGGGVCLTNRAFCTMYDGATIDHCAAEGDIAGDGGGVAVKKVVTQYGQTEPNFRMKGGTISYCAAGLTSFDGDGNGGGGGVSVAGSSYALIEGGTIDHCEAAMGGGGIEVGNSGRMTMTGGTITNGKACNGGGISTDTSSTVTLTGDIEISSCDVTQSGGAISARGTFTAADLTVKNCTARTLGGGIQSGGTMTLTDVTIENCRIVTPPTGEANGGGIYNMGPLTLSNVTIKNCTAKGNGGGICNIPTVAAGYGRKASVTMTGGSITDCTATSGSGGGIYSDLASSATTVTTATVTLNGADITGCAAGKDGGGIFSAATGESKTGSAISLSMKESAVSGCTAGEKGGGVYEDCPLTVCFPVSVTANTAGGRKNNLYLRAGRTVALSTEMAAWPEDANINQIAQDMDIGITLERPGDTTAVTAKATAEVMDRLFDLELGFFSSDEPQFAMEYDMLNRVLRFIKPYFDQQPTRANGYTARIAQAFSTGVSYQWHKVVEAPSEAEFAVLDSGFQPIDPTDGVYAAVEEDGTYYLTVTVRDLVQGQTFRFVTSRPITPYLAIPGKNYELDETGTVYSGTANKDTANAGETSFWYTDDRPFSVSGLALGGVPTAGDALAGQTGAALNTGDLPCGSYLCVATVAGGSQVTSVPVAVHSFSDDWDGNEDYHWHTCAGCGAITGAAAHSWNAGEVTTPAGCENPAVTTYTCTGCGQTKTKNTQAALGHDYAGSWSYDDVDHWQDCSRCDIPGYKGVHEKNGGIVTKEPTMVETGTKRYNCRICGCYLYTEELPRLDHDHDFDADGICTVCGVYQPARLVEEVYEIANAGNLAWFRDTVNAENYTISGKLTHDVDLSAVCGPEKGSWTPIGTSFFSGVFDGQGHTVSGLYINDSQHGDLGLFSCLGDGYCGTGPLSKAAIRNLTVSGSVSGEDCVGGLCGFNDLSTIENCVSAVTVCGKGNAVGGICGYNTGGIVKNCVNTGSVTGETWVGGIIGECVGGTLVDGAVESCLNTGAVGGKEYVGGICGIEEGIEIGGIKNCCDLGAVTASENYAGGIAGEGYATNCYYLAGTADVGIGDSSTGGGEAAEMTAEAFASGQVAWLLAQGDPIWGQSIGVDDYPVLNGPRVYYEYTGADCTEKDYTNTSGGQPGEHVWDQGAETTPAGCEDAGEKTYTCTGCGRTRTEEIEALGHDWQAATCTEPKTCSRCHATEWDALGHAWGEWAITREPTMEETGEAERVCARDAQHKDTATLPPLTDTAVWTPDRRTEPTDAQPGAQEYTSQYGAVSVTIPKLAFGLSYTEGTARVTAARGGTYLVIFAVYHGAEMTDCAVTETVFPAAGTKEVDTPASLAPGAGETVRVFLLSGDLKPLAPPAPTAK